MELVLLDLGFQLRRAIMQRLLLAVAAIPFVAGIASAAESLTNAQLDQVTAGGLPLISCASCITSSSSATSTTTNGVTIITGTSSTTGGGSGSGSGSGSNGGSGSGSGGGTPFGGTPSTTAPAVTLPSNLVTIVTTVS